MKKIKQFMGEFWFGKKYCFSHVFVLYITFAYILPFLRVRFYGSYAAAIIALLSFLFVVWVIGQISDNLSNRYEERE